MSILTSSVTSRVLADNRVDVVEKHEDHTGFFHSFDYIAPAGTTQAQIEATMNARKTSLAATLANQECGEVFQSILAAAQLDDETVVVPRDSHATRRQLVIYLREQLRNARNGRAIMIRAFLSDYASDADLQAAWGIGGGTLLNALKTRLANAKSLRDNWLAQTGE
jgi:hypothetical protein